MLCLRAALADADSFASLRAWLQQRAASLPCKLQQVSASANGVTTMLTAPRGRGEPSLSQTAGCKSSVVALGDARTGKRGNGETEKAGREEERRKEEGKEGMEVEKLEKMEKMEKMEKLEKEDGKMEEETGEKEKKGSEKRGEAEQKMEIESAQPDEKEERKEGSTVVAPSKTSIAIPLPAIIEVPATQESDRLFPR